MESTLKENKMGVMPVNKLLITMSLPMMASMLVQALYNVVDSIFVAQISENALSAVSLAFPLQNIMIALGGGTALGMNAILSYSLGEKNQEMAEYNLKSSHVSCLYYIYTLKNATATDLCERCEEDKATISRALDYLENNGFLTCESKSAKRYKSPLILTDKGNEAGKKIADKINVNGDTRNKAPKSGNK